MEGISTSFAQVEKGAIIDCTFGGGGHTRQILTALKSKKLKHCVIACDQDPEAIQRGKFFFESEISQGELILHHGSYTDFLKAKNLHFSTEFPILGLMADLGVSSDQIDSSSRGFSFRFDSPLDMRMNPHQGESCLELLQRITEEELAQILWDYGEERNSRKIARRLVQLRHQNQLPQNTKDLAQLIVQCYPPALRHKKTHPATQSFQALRIYLNRELFDVEHLAHHLLPQLPEQTRIAILTFHSLEDRIIKHALRNSELYELPSRKAITPSEDEIATNPRSRSAKLRLAIRHTQAKHV